MRFKRVKNVFDYLIIIKFLRLIIAFYYDYSVHFLNIVLIIIIRY